MSKMEEQEATDKLEELVGSVDKCFRLMRIYQNCVQSASGNKFTLQRLPSTEERFRKRAIEEGYSKVAVEHYLNHVR
jgi:hypothetical protein